MMRYLIDGYNLLFRLDGGTSDLSEGRQRLIFFLNEAVTLLGLDVVIVFDSNSSDQDYSRGHFDALEIIYSPNNLSADDYIIEKLEFMDDRKNRTVVTSDGRLAWEARQYGVKTMKVEAFMSWLKKRLRNGAVKKREKKEKPLLVSGVADSQQRKRLVNKNILSEELYAYYLGTFEERFKKLSDLDEKSDL